MTKNSTPIVVVAFNRPRSLSRLLSSLSCAHYPNKNIDLIISIDNDDNNQEVLEIANSYQWIFGEKIVKYQNSNLGLRKHILQCGDLSYNYGSVIVLEDDLFVSENFYSFTIDALKFSKTENTIGGISLYNHLLNVHNKDAFIAIDDGYDNWYFQFASSWGQAWTNEQWLGFKDWYSKNKTLVPSSDIPENVTQWSEKSWLKFYITYLIRTDKYFLYPKISLSTNFSDAGTHINNASTNYQVPLFCGNKKKYNFSKLSSSESVYDAYFENLKIANFLGISKADVCIDLYGYKENKNKRYWLTSRVLDFKILKTFGRSLRPIDLNILKNIDGNDFLLYDTEIAQKNNVTINGARKITYNTNYVSLSDSKKLFLEQLKMKCNRILKKLINI